MPSKMSGSIGEKIRKFPIHLEGPPHLIHGTCRLGSGSARAFFKNVYYALGMGTKLPAPVRDCSISFYYRVGKRSLPVDASYQGCAAGIVQPIGFWRRDEVPMHLANVAVFRMAGLGAANAVPPPAPFPPLFTVHL